MADLDYLINFNSNTAGIDKSKFAISKLGAAMAALGVGFGASELIETADEFSNLAGRINIAVGETGNFEQAMEGVKEVSLATNSNLSSTAELFTKINGVGKQMGLTQQDALDLTETINKAMQLGGGSVQSMEGALTQLVQALNSGTLRGEEFNSIIEQAPGLSKALATSLGATTGELRMMANEGKLSSETVIKALQDQSATIATEFDKLPTTVDKALQNIKTQWTTLIGTFNQDSGATSKVVEWLEVLENSMGMLDGVLADVGEGVEWIGDQISGIDTGTIVAMRQAFESAYDAIKSFAGAMAEGFEGLVDNIDLTLGMLFNFNSGLEDAESKTSGFTKALQAVSVALGFISDGFAGISIASKLISGAFYDMSAAFFQLKSNFVTGSWKEEAIANMQAMGAQAQKLYSEASDAALDFKSKGVAAIEDLSKTQIQLNAETLADLKANFADKTQAYNDFLLTEQGYSEQSQELEAQKLEAAQEYAQQAIEANNGVLDSTTQLELAAQNYLTTIDETGKIAVTSFNEVKGAADEVGLSIQDVALNAAKGLGIDVAEALNQVSGAFVRSADAVTLVSDGFDALKADGMNASSLLSASLDKLLDGAKSQAEIDEVRKLYVKFGQDGKLSTYQVETGVNAINEKLEKSPQLLDETTRAFKALGILSKEESDKQAREAIANYELVKNSGQASADQLAVALEGVNAKIGVAGNKALDSWYNSQEAALRYSGALTEVEVSTDKATRAIDDNSEARAEQSTAIWNASFATDAATQSDSNSLGFMSQVTASIRDRIGALTAMGATTEQVDEVWNNLMASYEGQQFLSLDDFTDKMQKVDDVVNEQVASFTEAKERANDMASALSGASVTSKDLADAQFALSAATDASVGGLIKMDDQTLSNLKNAIDSTRAKMQGLADDAKTTADNLEASLASLQGNDDKAREIEQAQKLVALEGQIAEAKARGNSEEVAQLNRALSLQKQINSEESKAANESAKAASAASATNNSQSVSNQNTSSRTVDINLKMGTSAATVSVPESQEQSFLSLLQQLEKSKAIAGY